MKKNKCALLVVEGIQTEPTIFKYIFEKYGYTFVNMNNIDDNTDWDAYMVKIDDDKTIYLVQGEKNRLNEFLKEYKEYDTLSEYYGIEEVVALNYIIYDFDYVTKDKMCELVNKFYSSQDGLLLLSNPCIEVIAEKNDCYTHKGRSTFYKRRLKKILTDANYRPIRVDKLIEGYICDNFEDCLIWHIKRNCLMFNSSDITEHPELLIKYVMETNIPNEDKNLFEFYYLSTVIYVAIAELEGLTKYPDNAYIVIQYLQEKKNKCLLG